MFNLSKKIGVIVSLIALTSCSSAYYSAMEKVGIHKRDIMVDRVEEAKESQQDAQQQFKSALEEMTMVLVVDSAWLNSLTISSPLISGKCIS